MWEHPESEICLSRQRNKPLVLSLLMRLMQLDVTEEVVMAEGMMSESKP